ncbi:hypothetical protein RI129_006317 [Pyrocoelia pectoralis]|uniref:Protein kinase domain-containing protein n=1 Tax=Pyrocoelia pectoralis TaxID=417401 RepID=A0AAN7ZI99_9COLE
MSLSRNYKIINRNNETSENVKCLKQLGYIIGKKIGEGAYSKVCVALFTHNGVRTKIACKIINKKNVHSDLMKKFLPREISIISMIDHPNIINILNILEINKVVYMFMEHCKNGDLLEYIRTHGELSERRTKHFFRQTVDAVQYLHNQNIAHRDLKCENIFLTQNNTVKLGDFGFARKSIDDNTGKKLLSNTYCGSAAYAAPEVLQGIPYDPKMYDVWSTGCILFIMLFASMPYDDSNVRQMLKNQREKSACLTVRCTFDDVSPSLIDLFNNILEPDASKRYTITEIASSKWLQELYCNSCIHVLSSLACNDKKLKRIYNE